MPELEQPTKSPEWKALSEAFRLAAIISNRTNITEIHALAQQIEQACIKGMTTKKNEDE